SRVSRHRHDACPPNVASDCHGASARRASRWLRLASSASEATKTRTVVRMTARPRSFLWWPAHNLYVRRSGTPAGGHGDGHRRLLRTGISGRPRGGDREAPPDRSSGLEGGGLLYRGE